VYPWKKVVSTGNFKLVSCSALPGEKNGLEREGRAAQA